MKKLMVLLTFLIVMIGVNNGVSIANERVISLDEMIQGIYVAIDENDELHFEDTMVIKDKTIDNILNYQITFSSYIDESDYYGYNGIMEVNNSELHESFKVEFEVITVKDTNETYIFMKDMNKKIGLIYQKQQ